MPKINKLKRYLDKRADQISQHITKREIEEKIPIQKIDEIEERGRNITKTINNNK